MRRETTSPSDRAYRAYLALGRWGGEAGLIYSSSPRLSFFCSTALASSAFHHNDLGWRNGELSPKLLLPTESPLMYGSLVIWERGGKKLLVELRCNKNGGQRNKIIIARKIQPVTVTLQCFVKNAKKLEYSATVTMTWLNVKLLQGEHKLHLW